MLRDKYKTKQKEQILNLIKSKNKEFTIKDIYQELNKEIGMTTIYRLVDNLVNEGIINKNENYYQYLEHCNCDNHFYLKCSNCGVLIHVDCDCINELFSHIDNEHKFVPNREHIIIGGICDKCRR